MDLIPVTAEYVAMVTAIGDATVTFTPPLAQALWLHPIKAPFTPGPAPALTDADIADFAGSTAKSYAAAARKVFQNPVTGDLAINMPTPTGGNIWATSATTNLPQTIYGAVLSSSSITIEGGAMIASGVLPDPVVLTAAFQEVDAGTVRFLFNYPLYSGVDL